MALLQKGYLGSTPLWKNVDWFEDDSSQIVTPRGLGVTVTANTSAHTKGSWSQLISSTAANASGVWLSFSAATTATDTATLLDIGTGASGSEAAIISNLAIGSSSAIRVLVPFKIASGTRIAARIQSVVTGGKTAIITAQPVDLGDYATAPTSVDVIGTETATSKGTAFSGASGTWVEAIASTSQAYRGVVLVVSGHDATFGGQSGVLFSIGVGASGSEIEFGSAYMNLVANETVTPDSGFSTLLFGRAIPSGSRLAVKHSITADPSKYGFCLIGIP
jgi:hypothetical protein